MRRETFVRVFGSEAQGTFQVGFRSVVEIRRVAVRVILSGGNPDATGNLANTARNSRSLRSSLGG
jgi:hypothetical protein